MCTHNQCLEQKIRKYITLFHLKIIIFRAVKNRFILHGRDFVMKHAFNECAGQPFHPHTNVCCSLLIVNFLPQLNPKLVCILADLVETLYWPELSTKCFLMYTYAQIVLF